MTGDVWMAYNVCMNTITTNISMPKGLYDEAKKQAKKYHYNSVSELIRDALRWWMNDNLTRNGFTSEFEEEVLKASAEPRENDILWEGKESDLVQYDKNTKKYKLHPDARRVDRTKPRTERKSKFASGAV